MCTSTLLHFFSGVKKSATEVHSAPLSCSLASSIPLFQDNPPSPFVRQIFVEISASTTSQSFLAKDTSTSQSFYYWLPTSTQYVYVLRDTRETSLALSVISQKPVSSDLELLEKKKIVRMFILPDLTRLPTLPSSFTATTLTITINR